MKILCKTDGSCLTICSGLKTDEDCEAMPVADVVALWAQEINGYTNLEEAVDGLELIAGDTQIAKFLYDVDHDQQVLKSLFSKNTADSCPDLIKDQVYFEYMSLRLKKPEEANETVAKESVPEEVVGAEPASEEL